MCSEIVVMLKNVFMYLLCNVIDYGIELFDEWCVVGKVVFGMIDIVVGVGGGELWFVFGDDGCGFVFDWICGIVCECGWIDVGSEVVLFDEEVVELIFWLGFLIV